MIIRTLAILLLTPALAVGRHGSALERSLLSRLADNTTNTTHSLNVSSCPGTQECSIPCILNSSCDQFTGYNLESLEESTHGLTAKLNLAGPACNSFGEDISNLTIQVTYETTSRCAFVFQYLHFVG